MICIHLYGDLRRFGDQQRPDRDTVVALAGTTDLTLERVLDQIGIPAGEVAQVFVNGNLLKAGSSMAPWLGYQVDPGRSQPGRPILETPIVDGDRLGLFPRRMAMLVV